MEKRSITLAELGKLSEEEFSRLYETVSRERLRRESKKKEIVLKRVLALAESHQISIAETIGEEFANLAGHEQRSVARKLCYIDAVIEGKKKRLVKI